MQLVADLLSFSTDIEKTILKQWNSPEGIVIQTAMW